MLGKGAYPYKQHGSFAKWSIIPKKGICSNLTMEHITDMY